MLVESRLEASEAFRKHRVASSKSPYLFANKVASAHQQHQSEHQHQDPDRQWQRRHHNAGHNQCPADHQFEQAPNSLATWHSDRLSPERRHLRLIKRLQVVEELLGAGLPGVALGHFTTGCPVTFERLVNGIGQIV